MFSAAIFLCCTCMANAAAAQAKEKGASFDASALRAPTPLDRGWLVHAGDDLTYAQPGFDDS
jgi:hypothetical protein